MLVEALKQAGYPRHISSIRRWTYPKEAYGTGGTVPLNAWPEIRAAAKVAGIFLDFEEFNPFPVTQAEFRGCVPFLFRRVERAALIRKIKGRRG